MQESSDGRRERSLGRQWEYIRTAAGVEAVRAGDREVDVEHVLLGLSATGGPSAAVLAAAGTDLARLRRAVVELHQQDVVGAGRTGSAPQADRRGAPPLDTARSLPVTARAKAVVDRAPHRRDDRGLLLALVDDERVRRLLQHLRADPDALRVAAEGAGTTSAPPPATATVPEPAVAAIAAEHAPPAGSVWVQAAHAQRAPVPAGRLWMLVSDPTRRPEWDHSCTGVSVDEDGVEHVTLRARRRRVVRQTVVDLVPDTEIAWAQAAAPTGQVTSILRVRIEPADGGAVVRLQTSVWLRSRRWLPLRPVLTRMLRGNLRMSATSVAQAAAADG